MNNGTKKPSVFFNCRFTRQEAFFIPINISEHIILITFNLRHFNGFKILHFVNVLCSSHKIKKHKWHLYILIKERKKSLLLKVKWLSREQILSLTEVSSFIFFFWQTKPFDLTWVCRLSYKLITFFSYFPYICQISDFSDSCIHHIILMLYSFTACEQLLYLCPFVSSKGFLKDRVHIVKHKKSISPELWKSNL